MEDDKVSLRRAFRLHFRAAKELHRIGPKLFPVVTLYAIVSGLLPYVTVFFSARILQELAVLRRAEVLWKWVAAGVLCTGLGAVVKAFLYQRNETLFDDLYGRKELLFVRKMFSLDYADIDKQETHDLRDQIRQNENWSSWGLMRAPEAYEQSLKGVVGIFSGIALTVSLFTSPVPETAGALTVLNHPVFIAVLAALILFITWLAGKCNLKSISYWSSAAEEATFGNRLFSFFGFIGMQKGRNADIRIYDQ
ncbi:MAG: hypothetical protein ACI4PH_06435, partial [Faecousia sp.]